MDAKENTPKDPTTKPEQKVNMDKHKEFIEGVIPKHLIRNMREMIIVMAKVIQEKNPQTDVNGVINKCLMTQGD